MKFSKIIWIGISIGFLLLLSSCSDDNNLIDDSAELAISQADSRGNGGPSDQGRNNGPGRGNDNNDNNQNGLGNADQTRADRLPSNIIESWSDVFLTLDRYATGMRPNATARAIAYINLAAYEVAVPFMDRYSSNSRRLAGFDINNNQRDRDTKLLLALNTAYADVLDHFLINVPSDIETIINSVESMNANSLSERLSPAEITSSEKWGAYVASQVIAYAKTDLEGEEQIKSPQPLSYEPPTGEGYWTYSADPERALFPYWKSVRTFVISPDETSTIPPMDYSENENSEYYAQMKEVYDVNNKAKAEQGEDLWVAEFWSDDVEGLMMSPPGRQVSIAKQLISNYDLNLEEGLVMMLKLGFSLNDAAVSTWADKYEYMVMRPSVYLREFIDPDFQTNLYRLVYWPNPSFPGYPSGHSCFASAAAGVFIDQFGDNVLFTDRSHEGRTEFRGMPRTFNSLDKMAEENAFSRIPLGVHVRMDCTEGFRLGYEIADAVNDLDLRRRGPA